MQTASAAIPSELVEVTSKDGTRIGVECAGTGPTLLFVHGGVGDRTRWTPMFSLLASMFTPCAMDRRGRGASGDSPEYSLSKEAEDVAAVVNSRPGLVASMAVHPRRMRALSAYRFDANRMKSVTIPTLLLIGEDTASPYARQSIGALQESLPNPTLVVLERQEHNAMEGGRDSLADAIIEFAAARE